ncbi:MAG: CCA tRNA nucleotidyltransferase [Candidatus Enterenecus sp.]
MFRLPPQVNTALALLEQNGHEAYVVGGAVRDLLRGAEVHDWDIAASALPEQTMAVFSGFPVIGTGLKHGTVTVLLDGMPLEITTYRVDGPYSDGRRPDSVSFTPSLTEDLARRDFTLNAMAYHPRRGLADPFGGAADLAVGRIRCVGDPDRRFKEDALRILRALRFAAVFGMEIEENSAGAIHRNRALLGRVAAERIYAELTRLLCGSNAGAVLREYPDVLAVPMPEVGPLVGFDQRNPHHCYDVWGHTAAVVQAAPPEPALRWAALFHDLGKPSSFTLDADGVGHFYGHAAKSRELAGDIMTRLRFDSATREQVLFLVEHHDDHLQPTEAAVKRAIQRFGVHDLTQLIALFRADALGHSPDSARNRLAVCDALDELTGRLAGEGDRFTVKDLAVRGGDLLALGYEGPALGAALDALVDAVVFDGVENKKEVLLDFLAKR